MRMIKKTLALLLVLALLAAVPVTIAAEESVEVFPETIPHSITEETKTGKGLAFLIEMNVRGAAVNAKNEFINTNAAVTIDGVDYQVVAMGAVMTNKAEYIAQIDSLTREDANDERTILDVKAKYLWALEEDSCAYAVRIINLPDSVLGFGMAARPYCVLKDSEGNESTIYGNSDLATYNQVYYEKQPELTPVLDLTIADVDDNLKVSNVTEYVACIPGIYREGFKVTLTLENVSSNAITSAGDSITYTCYDADGNALGSQTVQVGNLTPSNTVVADAYVPMGTASIVATDVNVNYVPDITLPAIGSDIDVTKKKDRIRVSAAEASFNEDGTIHVALTFRNYTSNWITEETDYVQYTYYNAAGTKIKTVKLYIGCIDTKKHPSKTFEFDLPANAARLAITKSQITYWTEWS